MLGRRAKKCPTVEMIADKRCPECQFLLRITFGALRSTGIRITAACLAVTFYLIRPSYKSRLEFQMSLRRYSVARILQNPCWPLAFLSHGYFSILIGVPIGVCAKSSSISGFVNAMHPFVQSVNRCSLPISPSPFLSPWIFMSPPGGCPTAFASWMSCGFG